MNNQKSDYKNLPDTIAFQHEFTRQFMESPEEVKDGYYRFKSKTGGYTMLYPVNAELDDTYYEIHKDIYEAIYYGEISKKLNRQYYVKVTYENGEITEEIEANLALLKSNQYKGEFTKEKLDDKSIYFAKTTKEHNSQKTAFRFLGYVKSNTSNQAVRFLYTVTCLENNQKCVIDKKGEEMIAKTLIDSINFNHSK